MQEEVIKSNFLTSRVSSFFGTDNIKGKWVDWETKVQEALLAEFPIGTPIQQVIYRMFDADMPCEYNTPQELLCFFFALSYYDQFLGPKSYGNTNYVAMTFLHDKGQVTEINVRNFGRSGYRRSVDGKFIPSPEPVDRR
ncbi:MAG: hypothetical protein AB7N54_16450 [Alphaproteobacteria bacterium]